MSHCQLRKIVLIALLVWMSARHSNAQDAEHLALITDLEGAVGIVRAAGGNPVVARWGTPLFEGDEVKTEEAAGASILFANNNLVTLGPSSSMTIKGGPGSAVERSGAVRTIDGPLLADVSGLTMHRTGQGDISALGTLRSGGTVDGVEPLAPRSTMVQNPQPVFEWHASSSMESFAVRVFDDSGLIWTGETRDRRLQYPSDAPALLPDREYLWQVEGEDMLEIVKSAMVPFTLLSPNAREEVAARESALRAQFSDDPHGSNVNFVLGSYYVQVGLLSQAISSFEGIADRHPDASMPYEILGKLYTDVGLKDAAIGAFQRAIALGQR